MRRLSAFIAILLLLSTAAPVMACVTSHAMSSQESACCRAMHGHCAGMAAMNCCKKVVAPDDHPQLSSPSASIPVRWTITTTVAAPPLLQLETPAQHAGPYDHAPPGLRIAQTTVLRI